MIQCSYHGEPTSLKCEGCDTAHAVQAEVDLLKHTLKLFDDGVLSTEHVLNVFRIYAGYTGAEFDASADSASIVLEPKHQAALKEMVRASEGIMPVSVESLVGMALDAFIEGATP